MLRSKGSFKIMVVEDNPADSALFETFFTHKPRKCEFSIVRDGEEALEYIAGRALPDLPDLIVLDINLPKIDGKEVLKELKNSPQARTIPVVILTSSDNEDDVRLSYEYGASCVLIKPYDVKDVRYLFQALEGFWINCVRYTMRRKVRN